MTATYQYSIPYYVANTRQDVDNFIVNGSESSFVYITDELRKEEKERHTRIKATMQEWFDRGQNL